MGRIVFILAGGPVSDPEFLRERIASIRPVAILCADGGARHAYGLGVIPDAIVGDMDSLDDEKARFFSRRGCRLLRHSPEKDETDTELALAEALGMNPDAVWIFGAMGRRLDHTLANLSLLACEAARGVDVRLVDPFCEVFLVRGMSMLEGEPGQTVSVFPLGDAAEGITLEGFEYPLDGATMKPGKPYGVSNRLAAPRGVIRVRKGALLVIRYFKAGGFPVGD
ncbi:MAG: thiamine diphosphokinase [Deltaproteobacteria bacterium HGW-Deltaproteobacteria-19]|jgi:thiamine pyrophosphokinase|nr:MAG: thiamine diphosphokinase [Deltaproteobacteria bacterium HGW-Deltaproteobacteria-19]